MHRVVARITLIAIAAAVGCTLSVRDPATSRALSHGVSPNRPGIAVVAAGGIAGWEHITLLDSASARYVTVTRRACSAKCAPLDSASGTLAADDVLRIYAIANREEAALRTERTGGCASCEEQALVTTAVFGNRRRTIVRVDREASPEVLGRVHVALAEAIRAARAAARPGEVSTEPNE